MIKKAITHLKLNAANPGKQQKLDLVAAEYMRVTQAYVNFLIQREITEPDKYASVPEQGVPTPLSGRWQRCAFMQACGIVQSWYSNECKNEPVLRNICIQANANVVVLEPSRTPTFDFWLRISTLEKGEPVRVPIKLYNRAKEVLSSACFKFSQKLVDTFGKGGKEVKGGIFFSFLYFPSFHSFLSFRRNVNYFLKHADMR